MIRATIELAATDLEIVSRTLGSLVETAEAIGTKERAPLLAQLDMDKQIRALQMTSPITDDDWKAKMTLYWEKWGSRGCVIEDVDSVLGDIPGRLKVVLEILQPAAEISHVSLTPVEYLSIMLTWETSLHLYLRRLHAELLLLRHRPPGWLPDDSDIRRLWELYASGLRYGELSPRSPKYSD